MANFDSPAGKVDEVSPTVRLFLLLLLLLSPAPGIAAEPLRAITRVRSLTPAQAAEGREVVVEAVLVTHVSHNHTAIVHDGHEGIFVELRKSEDGRPQLQVGDRLRLHGITQPGGFLPIIEARSYEVLGHDALPVPRRISGSDLFSPSLDCQWVEIPGVITSFENAKRFTLTAEISGWRVKLLFTDDDIQPPDSEVLHQVNELLQRPVVIRGVLGSVFNTQRQLTGRHFFINSLADIVPTEPLSAEGEVPLRAINELLRSDASSNSRVRVRGTVTWVSPAGTYLRGEGGSVQVVGAVLNELQPGVEVEAEGFASIAPFRPILRATQMTTLRTGPAPLPVPLKQERDPLIGQQAELVTVEAVCLSRQSSSEQGAIFQCQRGSQFFEAVLPANSGAPAPLVPGDRLRLTGICELLTYGPPVLGGIDGIRLHIRTPEDLQVLHRAPWWTLRRLIWALAGVCVLALVALMWAASLRRRVAAQTELIGEQIKRATLKDERQRIARELHDTIEQQLAGLSIQLRNSRRRLNEAPAQAGQALELAERMLRHCRDEARTSIRDLRSVALEQRGLPGALEEVIGPLAHAAGTEFSLEVTGPVCPLAANIEAHLLRIAQEAVSNALRHGQARRVVLALRYAADHVALEVRDNGSGFDTSASVPRGHFGLLGLRERAEKLHGQLVIESAPGAGTTVRIVVGLNGSTPLPLHETKDSSSHRG